MTCARWNSASDADCAHGGILEAPRASAVVSDVRSEILLEEAVEHAARREQAGEVLGRHVQVAGANEGIAPADRLHAEVGDLGAQLGVDALARLPEFVQLLVPGLPLLAAPAAPAPGRDRQLASPVAGAVRRPSVLASSGAPRRRPPSCSCSIMFRSICRLPSPPAKLVGRIGRWRRLTGVASRLGGDEPDVDLVELLEHPSIGGGSGARRPDQTMDVLELSSTSAFSSDPGGARPVTSCETLPLYVLSLSAEPPSPALGRHRERASRGRWPSSAA